MNCFRLTRRVLRLTAVATAFVAAAAFVAPSARAQNASPAALAAAGEVVTLTGAGALFTPLIAGVVEQAKILYLQQDPSLAKDLNDIATKMRTDLAPRMNELTAEMSRIYAAHFTEQELKDLATFYKSPLGKKLVQEQPTVADLSLKFAQNWANTLSDEVVAKMRDELKKKGHMK
jgi:hypothetical protein